MDPRYDPDRLRIGDAERERAVAALGEHYAVGRLTREEYDERCEAAWAARTGADLRPLFADLPGPRQEAPPRSGAPARARGWWPIPVLPVLAILIGLTVLTHLPVILFGLLAWCVVGRMFRHGRVVHRRW